MFWRERIAEAINKPYSGRDKKYQEHEYDGIDLHSCSVVIVNPYVSRPILNWSQDSLLSEFR